jgi:hypothetical protein
MPKKLSGYCYAFLALTMIFYYFTGEAPKACKAFMPAWT